MVNGVKLGDYQCTTERQLHQYSTKHRELSKLHMYATYDNMVTYLPWKLHCELADCDVSWKTSATDLTVLTLAQ